MNYVSQADVVNVIKHNEEVRENKLKIDKEIFEELKEGDKCTIKYPFGDLYIKNSVDEKHLFLAGG